MPFDQEHAIVPFVRQAGEILKSKWPGNPGYVQGSLYQETKSDGSIVTEADFASNEIIVSAIKKLFPEDGILSEEIPTDGSLTKMRRVWILDPLDGTAHFASGVDDFSILLGLSVEGEVKFGVMYFPIKDMMAVGEDGKETQVNDQVVRVSEARQIRPGRLYTRYCNITGDKQALNTPIPHDSGAAQFALCAGELDALVIKMQSHKEWDVAAPVVAMLGSGATVTDEHGAALRFNQGKRSFQYILASNGKVHDELLELVRSSKNETTAVR